MSDIHKQSKKAEIFETHVHFTSDEFKPFFERLVSLESDFKYLNVATSLKESEEVVEQANKFENVYCAIGVHPLYIAEETNSLDEVMNRLEKLILENKQKVLVIGEIGLDFYRVSREDSYELQIKWLEAQLKLASKYQLSSALHIRNAMPEAIEFLRKVPNFYGIIHSFDGTLYELKELLQLSDNCFISFSPLVLRNIEKFREIILETPINRLLVESDAPYLANSSSICRSVLRVISEVKNVDIKELKEIVIENSKRALRVP